MRKIKEHTCGAHIYMMLELEGKEYEVDCYLTSRGQIFKTTADGTKKRNDVISAFNALY